MELSNEVSRSFNEGGDEGPARAGRQEAREAEVLLLSPIVPHAAHALWHALGHDEAVNDAAWPAVDESALVKETLEMGVQGNGKGRGQTDRARQRR